MQATLVLMAALVKTRLADMFVSVLQVTRGQTVKPVSNYVRNTYLKITGSVYMEGASLGFSSSGAKK